MAEGSRKTAGEASAAAPAPPAVAGIPPVVPVGKIMQYTQGSDWENYIEQLDFFFLANSIQDQGRKKAILMANVPAATYQVVKDLLAPTAPSDETVTYAKVVEVMKHHVKPERSALVCRYEFDNRVRRPTESVTDYVKALKHLAIDCKFSDGMRNERLRDRFIAGLRNERMLRPLLAEKLAELTCDRAVQRCIAIEQASRDIETLQGGETAGTQVHETTDSIVCQVEVAKERRRNCYRCNGNHAAYQCRFKTATCHGCGKRGHLQQACRSPGKGGEKKHDQKTSNQKGKQSQRKVNTVSTHQGHDDGQETGSRSSTDSDDDEPLYSLFNLKGTRRIKVDVVIETEAVTMELDTGAAVSIISKAE